MLHTHSAAATHRSARCRVSAALALLLALQVVAASLPATAAASEADFSYWIAHAQTRVYPSTPAPGEACLGSSATPLGMSLSGAQAEFEGRQIAVRPTGSGLQDIWIAPSDLKRIGGSESIPAANVSSYKVAYVNVEKPSYNVRSGGIQPDPLLPMTLANGQRLGWQPGGAMNPMLRAVAANTTQPFYVLFRVPDDAVAGTYTGTLRVQATASDTGQPLRALDIPVTLTVHPFSVAQRTLKTSFGLNLHYAAITNSARRDWLQPPDPNPGPNAARVPERTTYNADQVGGWLRYMSDHRVSPQTMHPAWENAAGWWAPPTSSGDMVARKPLLEDYLGTGPATQFAGDRYAFNTVRMAETGAPAWVKNPFKSKRYTALAARYFSTMKSELGPNYTKAFVYTIDEPPASKKKFIEKYAKLVHRAAPGVPFLLTTDPTTQKGKLVKGVDIYVTRLHFFFRDSAWIRKIRKARKSVWIYTHATNWQVQTPGYLIDEPVSDSRSQGWFAWRTRADGLLYFSVNSWQKGTNKGTVFRDPYVETNGRNKTYKGKPMRANGDGVLVYPGYYPSLGLVVEGSPPVGSLRMEAVRDGLEDYEYLKLTAARYGTGTADAYAARIIGPLPKKKAGKLLFPAWAKTPEPYEQVRAEIAAALSR